MEYLLCLRGEQCDRGDGGGWGGGGRMFWSIFGKSQGAMENGKMEKKTGCKIICGAPTTFVVKGLMMMMMSKPSKKI